MGPAPGAHERAGLACSGLARVTRCVSPLQPCGFFLFSFFSPFSALRLQLGLVWQAFSPIAAGFRPISQPKSWWQNGRGVVVDGTQNRSDYIRSVIWASVALVPPHLSQSIPAHPLDHTTPHLQLSVHKLPPTTSKTQNTTKSPLNLTP